MNKKIAVIIATYNAEPWLNLCMPSVFSSDVPVEVYVVDNASTDRTIKLLRQDYNGKINLHCNSTNLGFGKANNIAIKQAYMDGCEYFFLLNQDCHIERKTISVLVKKMMDSPEYFIVSPIHLDGSGRGLDKGFEAHLNHIYTPDFLSSYYAGNCEDKVYPVLFVNAAAWMVTRKCIEEIGLFNPAFFHYGEDTNYIHRLKYHNRTLGVYPFAFVQHYRLISTGSSLQKKEGFALRHKLLLKWSYPANPHPVSDFLKNSLLGILKALATANHKTLKGINKEMVVFFSSKVFHINKCNADSRKAGLAFFKDTPLFNGKIHSSIY